MFKKLLGVAGFLVGLASSYIYFNGTYKTLHLIGIHKFKVGDCIVQTRYRSNRAVESWQMDKNFIEYNSYKITQLGQDSYQMYRSNPLESELDYGQEEDRHEKIDCSKIGFNNG